MPVNKARLGLQNYVTSAKEKYNSLIHEKGKLIGAVKYEQGF